MIKILAAGSACLMLAGLAQAKDFTNYRIIDLDSIPNQDVFNLGASENVMFVGDNVRTKRLRIEGGNDVAVVGVKFAPVYKWDPKNKSTGTLQTVRTNGSIWIEDVHIDNKNAFGSDAFTLNSAGTKKIPATIVNSSALNVNGSQQDHLHPNDRAHGDIVQPQGALSTLTIKGLNGSTDYQGLFLMKQDRVAWGGKVDKVVMEDVNLWHTKANTNCAYLLGIGGTSRQEVSMKNVTLTRQPRSKPCQGESVMNYGNASVTGNVKYVGPVDFEDGSTIVGGSPSWNPPYQPPPSPNPVDYQNVPVPPGMLEIPIAPEASVVPTMPVVAPPADTVEVMPAPTAPVSPRGSVQMSNRPLFPAQSRLDLSHLRIMGGSR